MDIHRQYRQWSIATLFLTGIPLILLGITGLIGWHTHNVKLIQIKASFTPMQYNTALCFLMFGLAFISLGFGNRFLVKVLSSFILIIASLTVLQYAFGLNLGIDQLFFTYNLDYTMNHPGRMALNTSLCFMLGGICLILIASSALEEKPWLGIVVKLLSSLVVSLSVIALIGYATGLDASTSWSEISRMAAHGAIGCLILGLGIFYHHVLLSLSNSRLTIGTPISIGIASLLITLGLWQSFSVQDLVKFEQLNQANAQYIKSAIESSFQSDFTALSRMAERWKTYKTLSLSDWQIDAENYLKDLIGIKGIYITDLDFQVQRQLPASDTLPIIEPPLTAQMLNAHFDQSNEKVLAKFYKDHLLTYQPLDSHEPDQTEGFLISQIDLEALIDSKINPSLQDNYDILISSADQKNILYKEGEEFLKDYPQSQASAKIDSFQMLIELFPKKSFFKAQKSALPMIALIFGIILSILASATAYFALLTYLKDKGMRKALKELDGAFKHAEQANLAKSAFLANMSHEIRTPLNGIIGTSALLQETPLNDKQKRYANRIASSGKILLDLINDILDLSKIEAGELKLEAIPCNIDDIVKEIADIMQSKIEEKKLELNVHYPTEKLTVISDPLRLKQVLNNIVGNAIKFTSKGYVVIAVKYKALDDGKILVTFEVKDTGIGIPLEKISQLFQKFYQADSSTTRKFGGTGLGLAISKQLVERLGGKISVESQVNIGSTFKIEIPFEMVQEEAEHTYPPKAVVEQSLEGKRALIVDDYDINCQILEDYLRKWKMNFKTYYSPLEALNAVKRGEKFDVALLDFNMPDMNGLDLAYQIKNVDANQDLPIILLSSSEQQTKAVEIQSISSYLIKPIYPLDLYKIIQSTIQSKTIIQPKTEQS